MSVPSIIFLKDFQLQQFSSNTALLSSGVKGQNVTSTYYSPRFHFMSFHSVFLHPTVFMYPFVYRERESLEYDQWRKTCEELQNCEIYLFHFRFLTFP